MNKELNQHRVKLIIADDHPIVSQGLEAFMALQPNIEVVACCASIAELTELSETAVIDVCLLDLELSDGLSIDHIPYLVERGIRVVVLTSCHRSEFLTQAVTLGATSYVSKSILPNQLVERIYEAHQGRRFLQPELISDAPSIFAQHVLTSKEMNILVYVAQGYSNAEIAEAATISIKTVKFHMSNILSKLQLTDRTQAAILAWQQKLVS